MGFVRATAMVITSETRDEAEHDHFVRMTIVEHLTELRGRLVKTILAVVVGGALCFVLYNPILEVLVQPYREVTGKDTFYITKPLEGFSARLKVASYGGFLLGSPVVLWQLWRFITPGLHRREKRFAIPFVVASVALFVMGAALALVTFPKALDFVVGISGQNVETLFSPVEYVTFILRVTIGFGVAFELPILLVFLQLAHVLSSAQLLRSWRWAVVGVFAAAAVITPSQDPFTLLAMAGPMSIFYFGAVLVGRLLKR